jgi:hypothetical protein
MPSFSKHGKEKRASMLTAKVKISSNQNHSFVLPVAIPELREVKAFANTLHAAGRQWRGEFMGWQTEYTPESKEKPADSNMQFTPADFWIGESSIWFFSMMWEHGKDNEPTEFLDERGIIQPA